MKKRFENYSFVLPAIVFLMIFLLYPFAFNIYLSFRDINIGNLVQGDSPFIGLENYKTILSEPLFYKSLTQTVIFTFFTLVVSTSIGFLLASYFNKAFPGNKWMRSIMLLGWMTPIIIVGTIFKWMLDGKYGIVNNMLVNIGLMNSPINWLSDIDTALFAVTVTNIWLSIPFSMIILLSGLQGIPTYVYEPATIDGASRWQKFRYITLPLMTPTISILLILGLIYTFKVFDVIYIMTAGGPANSTQVVSYLAYELSFNLFRFGEGAALSNLALFIIAFFAILYVRKVQKESVVH
ncbi:sugar ABC transporter permease [Thalassobacillus devorans]|uniref:Sugar ABC transporter permease n=1 Tax=Thalassobacillus devorans TaxID=279813 RepID=A0ABQ1P2N5_9BACI|nr:sugar ABC transporter permease [Thalassobacillus devorans]NIK28014.1 multiple sugar transport system permease protein [Thalassobacillus devorans]GGC89583.1 sugar ABC transporter permease [Thalassobacillus devorans]